MEGEGAPVRRAAAGRAIPVQRSFGGRAFTLRWRVEGEEVRVRVTRPRPLPDLEWRVDGAQASRVAPGESRAVSPLTRTAMRLRALLGATDVPPRPRAPVVRALFSQLPGVLALVRADGSFEGRFFAACCYRHALDAMPRDERAELPEAVHAQLVRARVGPEALEPGPRSAVCVYHGDTQLALVCDRHLESGRWHRGQRRPAMESFEFIGDYRIAITYRDGSIRVRRYLRDAHLCLAGHTLQVTGDGRHLVAWTVESESVNPQWEHVQDGIGFHVLDLERGCTVSRGWVSPPATLAAARLAAVQVRGAWPGLEVGLQWGEGGVQRIVLDDAPLRSEDGQEVFFCHEKTVRDARAGHAAEHRQLVLHRYRAADMAPVGRHVLAVPDAVPRLRVEAVKLLREQGEPVLYVRREDASIHAHRLAGGTETASAP